jgi:hypothetical protein
MPPRLTLMPRGGIAAFIGYLLLCLVLYWAIDSVWGLVLAAPALVVLVVN